MSLRLNHWNVTNINRSQVETLTLTLMKLNHHINRSLVDHDNDDETELLENTGDRKNPLWDHIGGDMTLLQCCTVGIVRTTSSQSPAQYSCSCVHWNVNIQVSSSLCIVSLYEPCRLYCANTPIYINY